MKFFLSLIATATLAFTASAVPIETIQEAYTELPARFAMYLVTAEPRANGLRIRYVNSNLNININESPIWPSVDGVFLGGRGRIALDRTVHKRPNSNSPTNPEPWGDWNMMVSAGVGMISVQSEESQALYDSWGPEYHRIVGKFVQNSNKMLRLVADNGELVNCLQIDGTGASAYTFWWDMMHYAPANAEFRIVPL